MPEVGRASEPPPTHPSSESRNVRLTVAYDGTDFHGFAINGEQRTVMGVLAAAVERIVRRPVELTGAGRTDAGVHAWGQVVTGMIPDDTDLRRLQHSINGLCRPDVSVRSIDWAAADFSARYSATSRRYRYDIWNRPDPNPLIARSVWHVHQPLDIEPMNSGAEALIGDHDFSSFCRRPQPIPGLADASLVRRLTLAEWSKVDTQWGPLVRFEIAATSFCHQMVRSIVGTLVDVGLGRRDASSIAEILSGKDRSLAGAVAPPYGLVLWDVDYRGTRWNV
jgi:tRNA pseudouridine38-40 synthase